MLEYHCTRIMKNRAFTNAQRGLTRRQLLGLATLTGAGFAAGSIGSPEANAALEAGATSTVNTGSAKKEAFEPLADFKYDLEASEGWVGEGGQQRK
jgi:hypothetical protein